MFDWHGAIALLVVAWFLQGVGMLIQLRRFRAAMRSLSSEWTDGWLGIGKGRGGLRKGAIAMVSLGPDERLRRVVVMEGWTVFAKPRRLEEFEAMPVGRAEAGVAQAPRTGVNRAIASALEQIRIIRDGAESRAKSAAVEAGA